MSYELYKEHRLAPDDNGCWGVLTNPEYEQVGTYPSKASAKRAIDEIQTAKLLPSISDEHERITNYLFERGHTITKPLVDDVLNLIERERVEEWQRIYDHFEAKDPREVMPDPDSPRNSVLIELDQLKKGQE